MSRSIIKTNLAPAPMSGRSVSISGAKAGLKLLLNKSKNDYERLDALMFYVEIGNEYTCAYGDMDSGYYNSIIGVYDKAGKLFLNSKTLTEEQKNSLKLRSRKIVQGGGDIGWGYGDDLRTIHEKTFQ